MFNPPSVLAHWIHLPWALVHIGVGIMIGLLIAASSMTGSTTVPPPSAALSLPPASDAVHDPTPIVDRQSVVGFGPSAGLDDPESSAPPATPAPRQPSAGSRDGGDSDGEGGSARTPVAAVGPSVPLRKRESKDDDDPEVIGTFRVLQSFSDTFIAEVLVKNTTGAARNWTVVLRFSGDVDRLRTAWVEGAPQARQRHSGDTVTFTSTVPVAGRSSVPLRFQFDSSGSDRRPRVCTVNGGSCRR